MIRVQSADGKMHEFPDGTSNAVIDRAMKAYVGQNTGTGARKPPAAPPKKRNLVQEATGAMANALRGTGVVDEMAAGLDMLSRDPMQAIAPGPTALFRAVTGRGDQQKKAFGASMARQRGYEDDFAERRPNAAALARGTGNAATAVVPAGSLAAFAQAPRAVNALRGATTAGLTAAGYAAADRGSPQERGRAAAAASRDPLVLGLGAAGGALATAARKPAKPKISPDVVAMRERGVQLTPGQMRGGVAKATEDAATSLPILGTEIQHARTEGLHSFGKAIADEALAPVGLSVPANIQPGRPTVAYVEKTLGKLYDETIPQGGVVADGEFKANVAQRIGDIAQDLTPEGRARLGQILDSRVVSRFAQSADETLPGELYQRVHSELGTTAGRFSGKQDADQQAIAEALEVMREELRNAAARQNPDFATAKAAIDEGYSTFKRLQGAAASPGAEGGVFTPAQYGGAIRRADKSVDKGAYARGSNKGQDFADSARAVLPSKVPDSGTATRGAITAAASAPGALIAGAVGGGPLGVAGVAGGYAATAAGLKGLSKLYTPEAIAAANAALDARISRQQQQMALKELERLALSHPKVAELYRQVAARLSRSSGVAATSAQAHDTPAQ